MAARTPNDKLNNIESKVDTMHGFLCGVNGSGGFIRKVEKFIDRYNEIQPVPRAECEVIRKDDLVKTVSKRRFLITTIFLAAGLVTSIILAIIF